MKLLFSVILALSFTIMIGCSKKEEPEPEKEPEAKKVDTGWSIATAKSGDQVVMFRYVRKKPKGWNTLPLSEEVSINWTYDGMLPDDVAKARMDRLEDLLTGMTDTELVLVMTGLGRREWCYYTKSYPEFMKQLNSRLENQPKFPIEIIHTPDPEWTYWQAFVDKIRGKSEEQ